MLEQLKTRINNATIASTPSGQEVRLTATETELPAIHKMWNSFIGQTELEIKNLVVLNRIRSGYLWLKGKAMIKGSLYSVNVLFFIQPEPEELACVIVAKPNSLSNWNFLELFPNLPSFAGQSTAGPSLSFLADLGLMDAHLIISSHANEATEPMTEMSRVFSKLSPPIQDLTDQLEEVVYGLNIFGAPSFGGELAFINSFIENTPLQSLQGFLVRELLFEDLHLFFKAELSKTIGDFTMTFEGFEIYTSTSQHILSERGLILYSRLQFDDIEINISGDIPIGGNVIRFDAYLPDGLSISSFTNLNALTNSQELSSALETVVDLTESIALQSASLGINIASPNLQFFEFKIGVDKEYKIIEDIIHLNGLQFIGRVDSPPSGGKTFLLELSAAWEIGEAKIDTLVSLPDGRLSGRLSQGSQLGITSIFQKFFPDLEFDSDLLILSLEVAASKAGNFSLFLEMADLWSIDLEITTISMQSLLLNIEGQKGSGTSGFIQGIFDIGTISFLARASVPGAGGGWAFSGATGAGDEIPIGQFIGYLVQEFGIADEIPEAIEDFIIRNISVSFNTGDKRFQFSCEGILPLDGKQNRLSLSIDIQQRVFNGTKESHHKITGELEIAGQFFTLHFGQDRRAKRFLGVYNSSEGLPLPLHELIGSLAPDAAASLPQFSVALNQIVFSYQKSSGQSKFIFWIDLDAGMDFSNLPLVGPLLPNDTNISVDNLQIIYAKGNWTKTEFSALSAVQTTYQLKFPTKPIKSGPNLSGSIKLGSQPFDFDFEMGTGNNASPSELPPATGGGNAPRTGKLPAPSDSGKWFNINKKIGPLKVARIGLNFTESRLWLMMDAQVALGPMSLILQGLSFGSTIDRFDPRFNLRGFGLSYSKGPVQVTGIFLRISNAPGQSPVPGVTDQFAGVAIIKAKQLTIAAIGEYAMVNGAPSFYLYAYLGFPIGGPAFFFIEGLAIGFGFNRSVRVPPIEEVAIHPMILVATQGTSDPLLLAQSLVSGNFIPIDPGKVFLAVGVRFSTFKLLDSFALLIVTFGSSFRLDILGISRLIVPPAEAGKLIDPLAQVTLAIKGSFIPEEGFLGIQAQLTRDSYILSKDCVLQGGFAFYTWFAPSPNAGEFVLTLGGYHNKYQVPAHYPKVPRLGFHWKIMPQLNITGLMYFALTPSAVMAGGRLEAVFKSGGIKAWFIIGADFIISWKPYYYDAKIYLNIGISVTFWLFGEQTISLSVGVDLHLWGPDFAGIATVDLAIVTFTIEFGALEEPGADPIEWEAFKTAFVPDSTMTMNVASGLLKEAEDGTWVINPKNFELTTDSVIPIKTSNYGDSPNQNLGVAPMDKGAQDLHTSSRISIFKDGDDFADKFTITPILKAMPNALWGTVFEAGLSSKNQLSKNVLSGFSITPNPPPDPDKMSWFDIETQQFNIDSNDDQYSWVTIASFEKTTNAETEQKDRALQEGLLTDYGFDSDVINELGIDLHFNSGESVVEHMDLTIEIEELLIGELI